MDEDAHGMDSITTTKQDVLDQLSTLNVNKAHGPDAIPPRLLKEAALTTCLFITVDNKEAAEALNHDD